MSSDPDPGQPPLPGEDNNYSSCAAASLPWTPWVPFTADRHEFRQIPKEPGLYRVRPVGEEFLMYIGETGRPLHQRLQDLRMELKGTGLMPWADPHAEAAALWAWRDAEGFAYECSASPLDASANSRRIMESYLLYRYRQETGRSPACNFNRFHPRYRMSTPRKGNLRGGKLEAGQQDNPAGAPGLPPLRATGKPGEPGWMGLAWSSGQALAAETIQAIPAAPGLYILTDARSQEILSIGQYGNGTDRLRGFCKWLSDGRELLFSFHTVEQTILPHQLKELQTDLAGNYFEQYRKCPGFPSDCR